MMQAEAGSRRKTLAHIYQEKILTTHQTPYQNDSLYKALLLLSSTVAL